MGKKASLIQLLLFCLFIGCIFMANLLTPDREFSEVENKYLKQMPKFTFQNFVFGDFTTDFEKYSSDQFVLRDNWITVKAASELAAGKKENNDVYYCKNSDGQAVLLTRFDAPDTRNVQTKAGYINSFIEQVDVPVYLGIIPGAAEIQADLLPENAPNGSQRALIEQIYGSVSARPMDFLGALEAHRGEYIFYRTDHHWTSRGAYYGYTALAEAMGFEAQPISHYDIKWMTSDFLGTVYSSSGFTWIEPDYMQTFVQPYEGLHILNYGESEPAETPLYDMSYLEKKDKYSMFFGGITPLLEIDTGNDGLPSLLILRDSYMDSLAPFLLEHFSKISIMDLRYYTGDLAGYLTENGMDAVLICYSASNFSTDTNLYKLAK